MGKTVVILQSNYIPWKGYFDLIRHADEFIFYDDVQYTTRDWRNRNKIKTPQGLKWLSIPVGKDTNRQICEVEMVNQKWKIYHKTVLLQSYKDAPYYHEVVPLINVFYENDINNLSYYNQFVIQEICKWLKIPGKFTDSRYYQSNGSRVGKLIDLLKKAEATTYLCGPTSKNYLKEGELEREGFEVEFFRYQYPEYPQMYPPFVHEVSILDLLFHTGKNALNYF